MLFGQCPHGGGDKLKGASLKGAGWFMVDNGHTLTSFVNCAKSNSANSNNVPIKVEVVFRNWAFFSKNAYF